METKTTKTIEIRDTRNGDWSWVYNTVINDPHLDAFGVRVYGVLASFANFQEIRPSMPLIAERANMSVRKANKSIKSLLELGYIKVEAGGGRGKSNIYFLLKKPKGCTRCRVSSTNPARDDTETLHATTSPPTPPHNEYKKDNTKERMEISTAVDISSKMPLNELFELFEPVNPSYQRLFPNKTQRAALERLIKNHGPEQVRRFIDILVKTNQMPYAPTIITPLQLEDKLGSLMAFVAKEKIKFESKRLDVAKL